MIDVKVLRGANIRSTEDGREGRIERASMPWVTVVWNDTQEEQSFRRGDEALFEVLEVRTVGGWRPLGALMGTEALRDKYTLESFREELDELVRPLLEAESC